MLKTQMPSQQIVSFADPAGVAFKEEIRRRLEPAIPASWPEVKELIDEHPRMIEVRQEWDRTRTEAGFGCITWPYEFGGTGFTGVEQVLYHDVAGELEAPQPMNSLGYGLAGGRIISSGNPEQQKRFLPRILSGEDIWCEGFSEPGGGADMANYQTTAHRTDAGWHIKGQKIWTTFSPIGDRLFCLVRTSLTAPKRHNLSVFLLDMHAPGVEVRPIKQITGIDSFGQVFIDTDIRDADDLLLGKEGDGWNLSSIVGARSGRLGGGGAGGASRVAEMAMWVRQLQRCVEETEASSTMKERVKLLAVRVEGVRWHLRRLVELSTHDRDRTRAGAGGGGRELVHEITTCGLEIGCRRHENYWRSRHFDYRKLFIAGGGPDIQKNVIANRVLGLGR